MIGGARQVHVWPVGDFIPHAGSIACHCAPAVRREAGGYLVTHNSVDGREAVEQRTGRGTGFEWATTLLTGEVLTLTLDE